MNIFIISFLKLQCTFIFNIKNTNITYISLYLIIFNKFDTYIIFKYFKEIYIIIIFTKIIIYIIFTKIILDFKLCFRVFVLEIIILSVEYYEIIIIFNLNNYLIKNI